jgi:hypothetical protein
LNSGPIPFSESAASSITTTAHFTVVWFTRHSFAAKVRAGRPIPAVRAADKRFG